MMRQATPPAVLARIAAALGVPGAMQQTAAIAARSDRRKSCMLPEANQHTFISVLNSRIKIQHVVQL
jgi:hypothetical protein